MALKSSFKQQCPSCEAMVPIRDAGLIGRKIDCPKCKYRFVVEEPEEAVEEVEEAPPKKGGKPTAVAAKKPAAGKAAPTKGAPAKSAPAKAGAKARADEDEDDDLDDEEDSRPKKKKSGGGSGMLIAGLGLGAVAVVALAVGGYFIVFSGEKKNSSSSGGGGSGGQVGGVTPPSGETKTQEGPKKETPKTAAKPKLPDAANLLPNDTQMVVNLPMEHLLANTTFNKAMLQTPGSFNDKAFQGTWGIAATDLMRVVMGLNASNKTVFSVMQAAKPLPKDKIVARLKLKAESEGNLKYYLLNRPLDALSTFLLEANEPHEKVALYFPDDYTVVCADLGPMQQFLKDNGKPKHLSEPPAPPPPPTPAGKNGPGGMGPGGPRGPGGPGAMAPPMGGMAAPGGKAPTGGATAPGGKAPTGGASAPSGPSPDGRRPGATAPSPDGRRPGAAEPSPDGRRSTGGPGAPGAYQPPSGFQPQGMMPGMNPRGGAATTTDAAPISASYLTVEKDLKAVLDQVEKLDKKDEQHVLLSLAVSSAALNAIKAAVPGQVDAPQVPDIVLKLFGLDELKNAKTFGFALTDLSTSKISVAVAAAVKDDKVALDLEKNLSTKMAPMVLAAAGLDMISKNAPPPSSNYPGMNGPGMNGPGMVPPGGPGMTPPSPDGRRPSAGPGGGADRDRMERMRGQTPGGPGTVPPGMMPNGQPGGEEKKEEKGKDGEYGFWTKDHVIALGVNYNSKSAVLDVIARDLDIGCIRLKSVAATVDNRSRIHELAAATQAYLNKEGHFPRGTVARAPSTTRLLDWRPEQRMSWMVALLPYLGNGEFANLAFENGKGWDESPTNLLTASVAVPQYLAPLPTNKRLDFFIHYPTVKSLPLAATHYVGIAGVGFDAAEYRADDAATAKLRGIFGYYRETKLADIKDEPSETILLLQVPTVPHSPWIAGGGSTVRGVSPDLDCVRPFVCTKYQDKDGTFAVMADGKVRFVPANIDPKTFQAMCTIAGGEKIKNINEVAPEVPPPDDMPFGPELKAEAPPPAAVPPPRTTPPAAPPAATDAPRGGPTTGLRTNQLKRIGLAYHSFLDANKSRAPARTEDLEPFYEKDPQVTAALKDGTIVVFWNSTLGNMTQGTSNTILGYEKEAKDKGGLVLMADGSVRTMSAKEFNDAPKGPGK